MRRAAGDALVGVLLLAAAGVWVLLDDAGDTDAAGVSSPRPATAAPATFPEPPPPSETVEPLAHQAAASPAAADVEPAPVLRGLVVRQADGSALFRASATWLRDDGEPEAGAPVATTDAAGHFTLDCPEGASTRLLLVRWQPVHALLEAGPEKDVPLPVPACERRITIAAAAARGTEQRLELDTGWTIAGTALTPGKQLLYGARFTTPRPLATAESDLAGRFFLRDLPHDVSTVAVTGSAPGRPTRIVSVSRPDTDNWRTAMAVILPEAGCITGTVLYPSGAPAVGARVDVLLRGPTGEAADVRTGTIGDAGQFEIADLPQGDLDLLIRPDLKAARFTSERVASAAWLRRVRVDFDRPSRVELILPRGVDVTGRVVDSGGAPLPYHVVAVTEEFGDWRPASVLAAETHATTDKQGAFTLQDVLPGRKTLVVFGTEYIDRHRDGTRMPMPDGSVLTAKKNVPAEEDVSSSRPFELARPVEVGNEGLHDVLLEFKVLGSWFQPAVAGRVLDDLGHPVVGARIRCAAPEDPYPPEEPELSTAGGTFELLLGTPRTRAMLEIAADGLVARDVPVWDSRLTPDLGDIVLQRAPRLVVNVVDDATKDLVPAFSAVLQQFGGGRPATTRTFENLRDGVLDVELDRIEGTWVLTLGADGWRRFRQHGDHLRGEPMVYLVRMTRP